MIFEKISELKTTLNLSIPIFLKENLQKLSLKKGENINKIIIYSLYQTFPELKQDNNDILHKIIDKNK